MKTISAIHPAITENTENILTHKTRAPYQSITSQFLQRQTRFIT